MFGEPPASLHRIIPYLILILAVSACSEQTPGDLLVPEASPRAAAFEGSSKLTVNVDKWDGSDAPGSLVVVVLPPPSGAAGDLSTYGPIRWQLTDSKGKAEWTDLPAGAAVCVHARSAVSAQVPGGVKQYPPAVGTFISEASGDRSQAPVLTGAGAASIPFTPEDYLEYCVNSPPVIIANGATKVDLQHGQAEFFPAEVLDLLGVPRTDIQRGAVTFVADCQDIPWLKNPVTYPGLPEEEYECGDGMFAGFLQSHTAVDSDLNRSPIADYRIEALSNILVAGESVDLVASEGFPASTSPSEPLVGEYLACNVNSAIDAAGDASMLDIGKYRWSLGVLYGASLEADPSRTSVWWEMSGGSGEVVYTSRTVYENTTSTITHRVRFDVTSSMVNGETTYACSAASSSGSPYLTADVYCRTTPAGTIEVSVVEQDVGTPPDWSYREFNIRTVAMGGGDSTEDPSRNGSSRAYTAFDRNSVCTYPDGNDDRFGIRL